MKLLSAKNKKLGIQVLAVMGGILVAAAFMAAYKAGAKGAQIFKGAWAYLKQALGLNNLGMLLLAVACTLGVMFPGGADGLVYAKLLGVLTTGAAVVTTFNTTYVPEFFHYVAATQLTGVKITVQGEGVIFDSDAAGLNHCGVSRLAGQVTNQYTFRISNGLITGKNVIWDFTNSAAQTPSVYVESIERQPKGDQYYLQLLRQAVLQNSGQDFKKFATLSFPSIAATDRVNVLYRDGTQEELNRADILANLQYLQNIVNTPVYMIDNYNQRLSTVNIIAGAAQTAYIQRWAPEGSGMISQVING